MDKEIVITFVINHMMTLILRKSLQNQPCHQKKRGGVGEL